MPAVITHSPARSEPGLAPLRPRQAHCLAHAVLHSLYKRTRLVRLEDDPRQRNGLVLERRTQQELPCSPVVIDDHMVELGIILEPTRLDRVHDQHRARLIELLLGRILLDVRAEVRRMHGSDARPKRMALATVGAYAPILQSVAAARHGAEVTVRVPVGRRGRRSEHLHAAGQAPRLARK